MGDVSAGLKKFVVLLALLAVLVIFPARASFPLENQYVWCFAKRTLPLRLRSDIQSSGISLTDKFPPTELRISCSPSRGDSYRECLRLSSHLFDLSSNWRSAVLYSKSGNLWEGISSISLAEAAALKYGYAISSAEELESLVFSEMNTSGLWKLSGKLGESTSGGYTALSLYSGLSEDIASGKFVRERSDNERFLSQIRGYYSKFISFARENHQGYLFAKNCSQYSAWSIFECSTSSWALVNLACAGNFSACVFATDCEATISNNVSSIAASLPSFPGYWERNPGSSIKDSSEKYLAYSEFVLRVKTLENGLISEIDSLSREVSKKAGALRRAEVQKIPIGLVFSEISAGRSAQAYSRIDFLNFSLAVSLADSEVSSAAEGLAGLSKKPAFERITGLEETRKKLGEQLASLALVGELAERIERNFDANLPLETSLSVSALPAGQRILLKSIFSGTISSDTEALREVACAPTIRAFPEHPLGPFPRRGEGLSASICRGEAPREEIFRALDEKYSEQVNRKRNEILELVSVLPESDLVAEFGTYEFLPRNGWISAETSWGFLSSLDGLYSRILEDSSQAPRVDFEESLIFPVIANRNSVSRLYGTISGPSVSGTAETTALKFPGNVPAEVSWVEGGEIKSVSPASGRLFIDYEKGTLSTLSFLIERNLGKLASATETYSSESVTSGAYSISKKYALACSSSGYPEDFLVGTGTILPEDGLTVSGVEYSFLGGELFLRGSCDESLLAANISYNNPISMELSENPKGFSVSATNALKLNLPKVFLYVPLPPNSTEISVDGAPSFQLPDGTVRMETSFSAGETKTFEIAFLSGPGAGQLPDCPFCCNIGGRTLSSVQIAEANYAIPLLVGEYQKLSESERAQVSALACQDLFSQALDSARKLISERARTEKQACAKISASSVSDRRILSVMKSSAEKLALLRKKYPWAPFENPPELSGTLVKVSEAEKDCNETLLAEAESEIKNARAGLDSALASAAIWAHSEFGNGSFSAGITLPAEVIQTVEGRIGNRTRLALSGVNLLIFEIPSEGEYEKYVELILSSKSLVSFLETEGNAREAIALAEKFSPEAASEEGRYLSLAKDSLSNGRVLDGLYAGHYSAILSERAGKTASGSSKTLAKILAVALSVSLAGAVIFLGSRRKGKKGKKEDDGIFGEIR
ncbi:MAG: hypothetical protein V1820_04655 [archaeon]